MLKRVELQHKVRLNGDEYDILLSDESNFKSAFDTLNYILGEYTKNENTLIGFDTDDYLSVFKSGGHRNIYFYDFTLNKLRIYSYGKQTFLIAITTTFVI